MGAFFNNVHVRKKEGVGAAQICEYIKAECAAKGLTPCESPEDADCTAAVFEPADGGWVSVSSDLFSFSDSKDMNKVCAEYSDKFGADVLALLCFDSDFLFMNLVNTSDGTDAWMRIGDTGGMVKIGRRVNRRAWEPKVADFKAFTEAVTANYACAEDALVPIGKLLSLDPEQAGFDQQNEDAPTPEGKTVNLYFSAPEGERREPPAFSFRVGSHTALNEDPERGCWYITVLSSGGASRGIVAGLTMMSGDSIETGEITFSDTYIETYFKRGEPKKVPIEMEKAQLPSGEWIYRWVDRSFRIPAKVDDSVPQGPGRLHKEYEREIEFIFAPHGNHRKFLDIAAVIQPIENPEGGIMYYPWFWSESKRDYLEKEIASRTESNNEGRSISGFWIPSPDDFDLDD